MFEFLFKYPTTVFAKGDFVFLARWPVWMLAAMIAAASVLLGFFVWRRRGKMAAGLFGLRPTVIWLLQSCLAGLLLVPAGALVCERSLPRRESLAKPGALA